MAGPPLRIFFDTSVYIAALLSPAGAAGELVRLAESGALTMVVSEQVILESDEVVRNKFPDLVEKSRELWKYLEPEVVPNPSANRVRPFEKLVPAADARILCAAERGRVLAFVTWNIRHFMRPGVERLVSFPILVPGAGLQLFRKWIEPYL